MSTTECGEQIKLVRKPRATGVVGVAMARMTSVWRVVRNRLAANALYEMDDSQLDDIGLTRHDVVKALDHSGLLDDPSRLLASLARTRARDRFRRSARG